LCEKKDWYADEPAALHLISVVDYAVACAETILVGRQRCDVFFVEIRAACG